MVLTTREKPTSKILLYLLPEKNLIDMQPWWSYPVLGMPCGILAQRQLATGWLARG